MSLVSSGELAASPPNNSSEERQKRREQILGRIILGQACVRGYLVRKKFKKWTPDYRAHMIVRNTALRELIKSERKFVNELDTLLKNYVQPLKLDGSIVNEAELSRVFSLSEAQHAAHQRALDELEPLFDAQFPVIEGLGHIIEQLVKGTSKLYIEHAGSLSYYQSKVQQWKQDVPAFKAFLEKTETKLKKQEKGCIDVEAALGLPSENLAELSSLVEMICDHTPGNHPDNLSLKNSLSSIKRTVVNAKKALEEGPVRAQLMSVGPSIIGYDIFKSATGGLGNRKFIREGKVTVNGNHKTQVFIFSDVILLTTPQKIKGKGKSERKAKASEHASHEKKFEYKFRTEIVLKGAKLTIPATPSVEKTKSTIRRMKDEIISPRKDVNSAFEIATPDGEHHIFLFKSPDEKQIWYKELKDLTHRLKPKGVFGVPLLELLVTEKSRKLGVPYVVYCVVNYLCSTAIATEDLFTKPGSASEVEDLRDMFDTLDRATGTVDLSGTDPYNASDLLKLYFRELPEPLLTFELYNDLIGLKGAKDSNQGYVEGLRSLMDKLPLPNRTLLQYLIHFLCRITYCAEVNRMSPSNIALVFGPELIRPKEVTLESHLMFGKIQRLIQTLIENYVDIFFD